MKTCVVVGVVISLVLGVAVVGAAEAQPWIPGVASLVLPGLGQLLNDELDKALVHFGVDVAIIAVGWYAAALLPFGYASYALVPAAHLAWSLFSAFDAYSVAKDQGFSISTVENGVRFSYRY